VTELVALFAGLLKTYPELMESLVRYSWTDLTQLIIYTHSELSRGEPISTPEYFISRVRETVPEEEWELAVHCTMTRPPASDLDPALVSEVEMERMTMALLWITAMITELQRRELDASQSSRSDSEAISSVQ